ncbi:Dbl domain-containing protein [Phanerochaete sordida]|uniref:Dbl domain-containing protein n=1 Tax=Phanerochaete sordida TaxID=48140 RepID=A0A9P3FXZ4_9APHY|nr:Dbl domain-containing protein [Phanerochaete sordida]
MEVLTPTSISPPPPPLPYPNTPRKSPSSLLARRPSAQKLLAHHEPNNAPPMIPLAMSSHSLLTAEPSLLVSNSLATGTTLRSSRAPSSSLLPFVPLTPIMASPRMTPDLGTTSGSFAVASTTGADASDSDHGSAHSGSSGSDSTTQGDYLTLGHAAASAALSDPPTQPLPTPSWTSTPPTPPTKDRLMVRPQSAAGDPSGALGTPGASTITRSNKGHGRPASVAVFPEYRAPSSPSMNSYDAASSRRPPLSSRSVSPPRAAQGLPRSRSDNAISSTAGVKRRRTLPKQSGTPSPLSVHIRPHTATEEEVGQDDEQDDVLLPSLSRSPRKKAKTMLPGDALARNESVSSSRTRRVFTLGDGDDSDNEGEGSGDGLQEFERKTESQPDEEVTSPVDDDKPPESAKGMRRYHALLELLATEVGYLLDLRALVSIYLEQLPSLTAPVPTPLSRPSPSALSISSLALSRPFPSSRSSFLSVPTLSSGSGPPESASFERHRDGFDRERDSDKAKPARRPIFSEQDMQLLRRNAQELLAWHERFVVILERALVPHGLGWVFAQVSERRGRENRQSNEDMAAESVDGVVNVIMDIFSEEAHSFSLYETFTPLHSEAVNLVRSAQEQYPVEWDAYEQRCSLLVAHAFEMSAEPHKTPGVLSSSSSSYSIDSITKRRRHSMSSLALQPALSPFGVMPLTSGMGHGRSEPEDAHKRKSEPSYAQNQAMRLKFVDYLIKPVQRICKYPLLFEQLKSKRGASPRADGAIEKACSAMRAVLTRVDRANDKQAHQLKSKLIAARLTVNGNPTSPVSTSEGNAERSQLTPEFLQSLGACLVSGALDVVYHQSNGGVRTKYLGAFLYVGGYLILAKVPKGGKAYEAKHWFSLSGFYILDEPDDDPSLPYAFHVFGTDVHLHFAASCQLEKTIWTAAIHDALSAPAPSWTNVPPSNFPPDARPIVTPYEEQTPEYSAPLPTPLPTIQSMSELEGPEDGTSPAPPAPSPKKLAKTMSRVDSVIMRHDHSALNRRTSTSSVKAFFSPLTFESRVSRPSAQIRQQVDSGLHDVISDTFVTVRNQVRMRDEELFQARKKPMGNMSRSNSGLTLSGFAPRKRYDSTAFASSRRKGSLDGVPDIMGDSEAMRQHLALSQRSKSSGGKRRKRQSISVAPLANHFEMDMGLMQSPDGSVESPPAMTQSSSAASSNVNSVLPSPLESNLPLPTPSPADTLRYRPKRTRSLVDNVRSFFHSRSISPTPSARGSPRLGPAPLDAEQEPHGGLVQWWRKGSLRRRVQSSPEVPTDDSAPVTPAASDDGAYSEMTSQCSTHATPSPMPTPDATTERRLSTTRRVAFSSIAPITRRRTLFTSGPERAIPPSESQGSALSRSKTLKNLFHFQRSNSLTPVDLDSS